MPKKFGVLMRSLSGDSVASESAVAPIRLKYMGVQSVDLDGNDDWDATVDKGEAYELVPAANARGKAAIVLRIERKRELFYMTNRENLMRILAGTKFPKKMDLDNLLYATGKGATKGTGMVEIGTIAEDFQDTSTHKWFLAAGVKMYMDSAKRHYFGFDLKTPMETFMAKTKIARLKASFRTPVKSTVKDIADKVKNQTYVYDGVGAVDPKYVGDENVQLMIRGKGMVRGSDLVLGPDGKVYFQTESDDPIENALRNHKGTKYKDMTVAQIGAALLALPSPNMYMMAALDAHAEDLRSLTGKDRSLKDWKELGFASKKAAASQLREIEKVTAKLSVPVSNPAVGARNAVIPPKVLAEASYGFLAATPHAQHTKDSWVVYAPTRSALTAQLTTLANAAGDSLAKAGKVDLYKIVRQSPLIAQLGKRAVAMSTAELKAKATFVRTLSYTAPVADDNVQHERPWTDIDPQDLNVSWSDFDPAETRLALTKLFNEGYFSATLRPRPTTKGLVFDIPTGARSGRDEVHGAARRVYQWLHNIGIPRVKVVAKWAPTKALIDFQFPTLSADAKESIRLLREKPPVIGAPIYTLDSQQHRTFQIYAVDLNSGNVFMYPVRNAQPLTNEPLTVLYAKVQRLVK